MSTSSSVCKLPINKKNRINVFMGNKIYSKKKKNTKDGYNTSSHQVILYKWKEPNPIGPSPLYY